MILVKDLEIEKMTKKRFKKLIEPSRFAWQNIFPENSLIIFEYRYMSHMCVNVCWDAPVCEPEKLSWWVQRILPFILFSKIVLLRKIFSLRWKTLYYNRKHSQQTRLHISSWKSLCCNCSFKIRLKTIKTDKNTTNDFQRSSLRK